MPELPPFTARVDDARSALAAIQARVEEGRRIDPANGCFEEPSMEFETKGDVALLFGCVLLWLGAVVTIFFTRGTPFLALLGGAVATTVISMLRFNATARRVAEARKRSAVRLSTWIQANHALFQPGTTTSLALHAIHLGDPSRMDPDTLAEQTAEAVGRLRGAADLPASLDEAKRLLGGHGNPTRLPLEWFGGEPVLLANVMLGQKELPRGVVDERIVPLLVDPSTPTPGFWQIPKAIWWREDVEAALQARGDA